MRYLKEKGSDPSWQPSLVEEEVEEDDSAVDEIEEGTLDEVAQLPTREDTRSFIDRLPNLKKHRNRLLMRRLSFVVGILLIPLLAAIYYVSPLSKLGAIEVVGTQEVESQAVIASSQLHVHKNLWTQFFQRETAEQEIKKALPKIKTATITLKPLNDFEIKVTEYQKTAQLVKDGKYLPILDNGIVLESEMSDQPQSGLAILEGFTDQNKIADVLAAYQKLPAEIREGISQIKYAPRPNNDELLNLFMNDGNQVLVNISNMDSQMRYYAQIAKDLDSKSIIDMEVGIFTYPSEEPQPEETANSQEDNTDS